MLKIKIYFSILNFVLLLHGISFQVLHADVHVSDVKIETVDSQKLVSIVPHQTYHVPQLHHLEATLKIVKTQSVVKLTLSAYEGDVKAGGADFTQDGGPQEAGDGFNSLHFKAVHTFPAGKEYHFTRVEAVIVTNVTTTTESLPLEFTIIVATF